MPARVSTHASSPGGAQDGPRICSILAGFGSDDEADATVAYAGRLAHRHGARLTVVAAMTPGSRLLLFPEAGALSALLVAAVPSRLQAALAALPADISVTHLITAPTLVHALKQVAGTCDCDIVVLPSGRGRLRAVRRALRHLPGTIDVVCTPSPSPRPQTVAARA